MDLTDDVVQQLREKAKLLRSIADQLAGGEHLRSAVTKGRDPAVWTGSPQIAFCGWLDQLDRWVREQLAPGVAKVAEEIERHAGDVDDAQRKLNNAVPGVGCPLPAGRVRWTPTRPPEFVMQIDHAEGAVFMAPPEMEGLVTNLGQAKDAYYATGRQVEEALAPPRYVVIRGSGPAATPYPIETQVAAQLTPQDHIPPDAAESCGYPALLPLALAMQLERALQDVLDRSRKWARAAAADAATDWGGLFGGLAGLGAALAKADAIDVPTTQEVSRQQGAADATRFAAVALPGPRDCPRKDDVARLLEEIRAKSVGNHAYAAGFAAAMGDMHYEEYGLDEGNGFEYFNRKVQVCGTDGGAHEQRWGDLLPPVGEIFASATHDETFDMDLARRMLERGGADFAFLSGSAGQADGRPPPPALRTDVALLVADHWIKAKDWRQKTPLPLSIANGLKVLKANPEAAHIYALAHAELLTKGTNPDLLDVTSYGYPDPAPLAADVLRIGLFDYPANLAASAVEGAAVAADQARAAADKAMGAAIKAVGDGADPGPEGRLVLADFLASHIKDAAAVLHAAPDDWPRLKASAEAVRATTKELLKDPTARGVLLAGAADSAAAWGNEAARFVGDDLELHSGKSPRASVTEVGGSLTGPGARALGAFYGDLATGVLQNSEDKQKAASEMAGILGFMTSQGLGKGAALLGAAAGGGVAGLTLAWGAGRLAEAVSGWTKDAEAKLAKIDDAEQLRTTFLELVRTTMERAMAIALWADPRIRARLLQPDPPDPPGTPPNKEWRGVLIQPPLEDATGALRFPAPGEEPAWTAFDDWYRSKNGGLRLKALAVSTVEQSGMLDAFQNGVDDGLFRA